MPCLIKERNGHPGHSMGAAARATSYSTYQGFRSYLYQKSLTFLPCRTLSNLLIRR